MPFEVKAIPGESGDRRYRNVATDIAKFYERAERLGGQVLAGYSMTEETHLDRGTYLRASTLFLVAKVPEERPTE